MKSISIKEFCKEISFLKQGQKVEFYSSFVPSEASQSFTVTRMPLANVEVLMANRFNGGALFAIESKFEDESRNTILLERQFLDYLRQCGFENTVFVKSNTEQVE